MTTTNTTNTPLPLEKSIQHAKTLFPGFQLHDRSTNPELIGKEAGFILKCDPYQIEVDLEDDGRENEYGTNWRLEFTHQTHILFEYESDDYFRIAPEDLNATDDQKIIYLLDMLREELDDLTQKCYKSSASRAPLPTLFFPESKHLNAAVKLQGLADDMWHSIDHLKWKCNLTGQHPDKKAKFKQNLEEMVHYRNAMNAIAWALITGTLPECLNPIWENKEGKGTTNVHLLKKRVAVICYKNYFNTPEQWRDAALEMFSHSTDINSLQKLSDKCEKMQQAIDLLLTNTPHEILAGERS